MISTEWGNVWALKDGFNPADVANGNYGTHLNVFDWKERKLIQRIDVGIEGVMPLEIRYYLLIDDIKSNVLASSNSTKICLA